MQPGAAAGATAGAAAGRVGPAPRTAASAPAAGATGAARPVAAPAARPAPRIAPASARAGSVVIPAPRVAVRARVWPIVLAILAAGGLAAGGLVAGARFIADALATAPARAVDPAPAPPVAAPAPAVDASRSPSSGQLAPIGGGRVVYTTAEGHLVVLLPDPTSGELSVERVYVVSRDAERHLGDPDRRRLHGYYLDDLEDARARALAEARARHALRVAQAAVMPADLDDAEAAAAEVVRLGGADALAPDLEAPGVGAETAVRRRCAALALGEAGYRKAIPGLLVLLEGNSGPFAARVARALSALTGLALDPEDPARSIAAVRTWLDAHPLEEAFERAPPR